MVFFDSCGSCRRKGDLRCALRLEEVTWPAFFFCQSSQKILRIVRWLWKLLPWVFVTQLVNQETVLIFFHLNFTTQCRRSLRLVRDWKVETQTFLPTVKQLCMMHVLVLPFSSPRANEYVLRPERVRIQTHGRNWSIAPYSLQSLNSVHLCSHRSY